MDDEIEKEAKKTIPEIFAESGEVVFRELETKVTKRISANQNLVIACGGGIIKNKINIDMLRLNGILIFLDRDLNLLESNDPNRPLSSSQKAVEDMYHQRMPYYLQYSDIQIVNNTNLDKISQTSIQKVKDHIQDLICTGGKTI